MGRSRRRWRAASRRVDIDITERKRLEQEILAVSEREQRRIGQDMHDDLCQRLAGIQLMGDVLQPIFCAKLNPKPNRRP
jgi:signal transduction histidine kinase